MPRDSTQVGEKGSSKQRQASASADGGTNSNKQFLVTPPSVSLPKGGGAIRGIGEKFASNPVTGSGSMSAPIALSAGRGGFGPQLSLSYDSGAGQSVFGLGWNLSVPSISRKTDKGLPRYRDFTESDVFLISGAEDLVPVLNQANGQRIVELTQLGSESYNVHLYRPRIEGLFARIERWTQPGKPENTFWRSLSRDNIATWYGRDDESRIFDPEDHTRIYQWLLCETYDDKGNVAAYRYIAEDSRGVDSSDVWEANRQSSARQANRYLKRILYGNVDPYLPNLDRPLRDALPGRWMFEAVFDYGDHGAQPFPTPLTDSPWNARADAFSSHRGGFEIRTYRLCRRVLMFHHFPAESDVGQDCLVRSTDFGYELPDTLADGKRAGYTVLRSVTHRSYQRKSTHIDYHWHDLPPVEFTYSQPVVNQTIQHIDPIQLENLPVGTQGPGYRWLDLDGEGLSGVLAEQAGGWYYKPNLGDGTFGAMQQVARVPTMAAGGRHQFMDLAGDGEIDVVDFDGPSPGFHERDVDEGWKRHVPFVSLPNINWQDPNLRFVDLTGDGHADALITEHEVFTWYPSLDEQGFAAAQCTRQAVDEDAGPQLVFADGTQTIFLADMCGDGLTDLVRIRNGEVAYWPNLGYGSFGRKVTLGNSPCFDHPDLFDPNRIRLSDIDGSGPIDIIYLGREGAHLYFNRSGNSLSDAMTVAFPLVTENLGAVQVADLMGNGTACLVWNSHLPADAHRPVRYIDLMGGQKPHLMVGANNNLGATTQIDYSPSTKFYLRDKAAGRPWITNLPFPVHVVEKVTVNDKWRNTAFSSTYSYHHGYFDGVEREFRGFGRVEQVDVEDYGRFATGNIDSPYITDDQTLYQPPVKTITWFHTGAALNRQRILSQFEREYFPNSIAAMPNIVSIDGVFREKSLPEPEIESDLNAEEWREALRACKGMTLRQEVYELKIDPLQPIGDSPADEVPVRLFSAVTHNCNIRRLQPKGANPHAVFLVTESEAVSYHYELDLQAAEPLQPDPRVAHTLNLLFDEYGNVQQTVAVGYPRWRQFVDADPAHVPLIQEVQRELHVGYSETRYTGDAIDPAAGTAPVQYHRLRVPCEVQTYELTGFIPTQGLYFDLSNFRSYRLSETLQPQGATLLSRKRYHELPQDMSKTMRVVEHARTLFFDDDATGPDAATRFLKRPLPLGTLGKLGLPYEQYKLALTGALLNAVFTSGQLDQSVPTIGSARDALNNWKISGYLSGANADDLFGVSATGEYWMRSGVAGFAQDAAQHFYLPEKYTDPFDNPTTLEYDGNYDLFVRSSSDALGNTVTIEQFDYRVLAPLEIKDPNDNYSAVAFDVLGMAVAFAVMGKLRAESGDNLLGLQLDAPVDDVEQFFIAAYDESTPTTWLGNATARHLYDFGVHVAVDGTITYAARPASACGIVRETHVQAGGVTKIQVGVEYSDGMGTVLVKKTQAEPDPELVATGVDAPLRWIASGKTVLNNKGKPVKQYEPYFSLTEHRFDTAEAESEIGVTPIMYYDAVGRLMRTEMPDGTFSRVEFSPWFSRSFDQNDTVLEPNNRWYTERTTATATDEDKRAARLATVHSNTPAQTHLDSLGREVIAIAHNRVEGASQLILDGRTWKNEYYLTFTKLDAEGKPLWIRDARGNLVMQYITPYKANNDPSNDMPFRTDATGKRIYSAPCYDIAGNLLSQHSMDAGDRWMLMDAAGKPMFAWDRNERQIGTVLTPEDRLYFTKYDALHRPIEQWLSIDSGTPMMTERFEYRDTTTPAGAPNPQLAALQASNLISQLVQHYDPSGRVETLRRDFKGNVLETKRRLNNQPMESLIDWQGNNPVAKLETETFRQLTEFDALNRMTKHFNWHRDELSKPVARYVPIYSERGLLLSEQLTTRLVVESSGVVDGLNTTTTTAIKEVRYNVKGQKEFLILGNGTITQYDYDNKTFRLKQLRTTRLTTGQVDPAFPDFASNLTDARVLQQLHYTYDPVGNIAEIYDEAYGPVFFQNQRVESRSQYEYDALYRLISATGRENGALRGAPTIPEGAALTTPFPIPSTDPNALRKYTQTFSYDKVGNIDRMHHDAGAGTWTRRFHYADDSNRLLGTWDTNDSWATVNPAIVTPYAFDTHGNMLNLRKIDPRFNLRWDHRDMIGNIDLGGGGQAHYQYDAGKQRTRKYIEQEVTNPDGTKSWVRRWERIYLNGYELYRRYTGDGTTKVEEIESHHLFEGEQRVLLVDDVIVSSKGTTAPRPDGLLVKPQTLFRYQYSNHLGSASLELDHLAEIISYEEYHPYGTSAYRAMKSGIEAPPKRYRYTGMERDEESGLSYHGVRYYAVWLGRWVSSDPAGLVDQINLFGYSHCSPLQYSDRSGLAGEDVHGTAFDGGVNDLNSAAMINEGSSGTEFTDTDSRGEKLPGGVVEKDRNTDVTPKEKPAWKVTSSWSEDYIAKYRDYAERRSEEYRSSGSKLTCEDFALALMMDFARENGLPFSITNESGIYTASDYRYESFEDFRHKVLKTTASRDLQKDKNALISQDPAQPGDIIVNRNSKGVANHVQVVTGIFRSAQIGQPDLILIHQGTADWLDSDWAKITKLSGFLSASDPASRFYTGEPIERSQYSPLTGFYFNQDTGKTYSRFDAIGRPELRKWNFSTWK